MLSDRLMHEKKRFGASSENTQMDRADESVQRGRKNFASDGEPWPEKEIEVTSHKRKKHAERKEDLSHFRSNRRMNTNLLGQERCVRLR